MTDRQLTSDAITFSRAWAMPSADTFTVRPIREFVQRYVHKSKVAGSVDPFARNNQWAYWTNDINPETSANFHLDAVEFLEWLQRLAPRPEIDLAILDPPYSPRQISEAYRIAGRKATRSDTQNAAFMARIRKALMPLLTPDATVLSFGWNSAGMGKGFERREILLVNHGGAHNDTICVAEQRL